MDYLEKVFKKSSDIVSRKISDEFILVPTCKSVGDMDSVLYTLNEVSGRIWELIDNKRKVKEIRDKLLKEYEVPPQELEEDIIGIIKEFEELNCISEVSGK